MEKIKLEYIMHDKFEVVYRFAGMNVVGRRYSSDTFKYDFPEFKQTDVIKIGDTKMHILDDYEIPRYGESLKTHLRGEARDDLEQELNRLMSKEINQQILIEMLFNDIIVVGETT